MATVIALMTFLTVMFLVLAVYYALAPQAPPVMERLEQLKEQRTIRVVSSAEERKASWGRWARQLLQSVGQRFGSTKRSNEALRKRLMRAGFYGEMAVANYNGIRLALAVGLPLVFTGILTLWNISIVGLMFALPVLALIGLSAPSLVLDSMITRRRERIQRSLADAVDLMVACVEAGLSINAAILRVSQELKTAHPDIAQELHLCALEIRAGKPRDEAFRALGERTGVKDMKALAAMLIQTERFGTSIARALRVFADSLRTKRRQRAEEAAAKTTIKLIFPLVFFIFPAILVVLLGPGLIRIMETLGTLAVKR
ncbi:MAG: type II secretion system F family protein [Blastocatellia bacterium]|nr:type II secretion system F family protein [Blastocatellia bacterium]